MYVLNCAKSKNLIPTMDETNFKDYFLFSGSLRKDKQLRWRLNSNQDTKLTRNYCASWSFYFCCKDLFAVNFSREMKIRRKHKTPQLLILVLMVLHIASKTVWKVANRATVKIGECKMYRCAHRLHPLSSQTLQTICCAWCYDVRYIYAAWRCSRRAM